MSQQIKVLSSFRKVSIAEGISFVLLMFIAMPLKYMAGLPLFVKYLGWAHGVLFIMYVIMAIRVAVICNWKVLRLCVAILASLLPFGPFVFDKSLKREQENLN